MFTVREKSSPTHFGPFLVQISHFFAPNHHFGLYLLSDSLNFDDFLYRNYSYGHLLENWGLQSRKIYPRQFGPFLVQHIFKACLWLGTWSNYSNCIYFLKALWNSFVMTLFLVFKCENKCESLCKQSQKTMKECSIELGTKAIK